MNAVGGETRTSDLQLWIYILMIAHEGIDIVGMIVASLYCYKGRPMTGGVPSPGRGGITLKKTDSQPSADIKI